MLTRKLCNRTLFESSASFHMGMGSISCLLIVHTEAQGERESIRKR